jgi:alkanesulfonate monooxygenase SsuD/methylene tetrahydromethanopterin reductase-like flavin-dependent oxidoreductase (luciferase family)
MQLLYFHERPYGYVPEEEVIKNRGFFGVPNRFFDPEKGSELYNTYLDEMVYVEEMGLDGVVLNEHHGTPFCMGAVMDVEAAILARITKKMKIVLLGNPLPVVRNPIRLAEELAEIDMISRGRLVTGWVRGAGSEQLFNNVSPAYNREFFNEAHDLVIKCWTQPGPFRFEGKHFHFRFVNPWALPYQKPHPPIWIPGLLSPESVIWAAEHRYPYIGLGTGLKATSELWNIYADRAAELGFQAGPENFGYMQNVYVADTEEKAQEVAKLNLFGGGGAAFARPEWTLPPGYNSKEATKRLARQQAASRGERTAFLGLSANPDQHNEKAAGDVSARTRLARGEIDIEEAKRNIYAGYQKAQDSLSLITGTPKTVLPKLKHILEVLRCGAFAISQVNGPATHADRMMSIKLFGQEVAPALREYAKELGLNDAFQVKPGSRPVSGKRDQVSWPELLPGAKQPAA